jgi:peptidoglycan hydrolase-like protein with peptidoglycan-binding domain
MVTGYFGVATQTAVKNYQSQRGLAQTGIVDSATRAALSSCSSGYNNYSYSYVNQGGATNPYNSYNYNYTNPINTNPYTYNYNNGYNYNYNYGYNYGLNPYSGTLHIDTLSVTSAVTGASVTIAGSGFDYNSNTVYVGSTPVANVASWNGNALSFVVPQNVSGSVLVYVANSRGSSNSLTLNVINYGTGGCSYPYYTGTQGNCGCSYSGGCAQGQLSLTQLSPDNGTTGSSVTIYGSGFTTTGNTVHFGSGVIINLSSLDGRALSFTVPTYLTGYQSQTVGLGSYPVSVTNGAGFTSNTLSYNVTSLGVANKPNINSVTGPNTLQAGVAGTWTVTLSAPSYSYTTLGVTWGDESQYGYNAQSAPQSTYLSGAQTFTFSHTYNQSGTYTVTFTATNVNGQSNTSTATVTVSGQGTGTISLNSMSPTSGRVGTQIVLTGSGFTSDNTIHFGIGGVQHVPSYNGTTLYLTVPSYISPCDVQTPGTFCALYAQQVTPGIYQVFVSNTIGQSAQQSFTVTQ